VHSISLISEIVAPLPTHDFTRIFFPLDIDYRSCYAILQIIDEFSFILDMFPFYKLGKGLAVAYLMFFGGAKTVFKYIIEPFMDTYEHDIDRSISKLDSKVLEKYFKDPDALQKLIKDKESVVKEYGAKEFNRFLQLLVDKSKTD
jgi:TB2/DP1, HVA22 family